MDFEDLKKDKKLWRLVVAARRVVIDFQKLKYEMNPRQLDTFAEISEAIHDIAPISKPGS
ncbi:MAG: hypothetical protein UY18_C0050G0006 [Microgenomates group bacterium GW2011_GWF2_47_9]|nr:MAG: hypothetical protein UY18_C0050G0006 [Microgenomates group bacterium GW2011_GWF2_47_9]